MYNNMETLLRTENLTKKLQESGSNTKYFNECT